MESGPPVALDDAKGRRSIGIISAVGSKFAVQKIGVTVFGNEYNVVPVATWGIDDLIASTLTLLLGGKSRREAVTYAEGASLITRRQAGCLVAGESEG